MPRTLAVVSSKGGAGKTTLAINLAVTAELDGRRAQIIELDPQASQTPAGPKNCRRKRSCTSVYCPMNNSPADAGAVRGNSTYDAHGA